MVRAVVRMESCETDLWKGARKPVRAVSPLPPHAGPKPPAVVLSEWFEAGGVYNKL